jgi:hypothetical protein
MEGPNLRIKGNPPSDPGISAGISGRGNWSAENDVIYFGTDRETDIDYNYTLNLDETRAKFKIEPCGKSSGENPIAELEFIESGIFWMNGIEMEKRN